MTQVLDDLNKEVILLFRCNEFEKIFFDLHWNKRAEKNIGDYGLTTSRPYRCYKEKLLQFQQGWENIIRGGI